MFFHKAAASTEQALRSDQTTRIHAAPSEHSGDKKLISSWHEVGRPQVHGYDLLGVVSLDPLRFVSIADEKVARVFGAPRSFVKTLRRLGVVDLEVDEVRSPVPSEWPIHTQRSSHHNMTTGDAPRERNRSATRLVQQGYERQSARQLSDLVFTAMF